MRFHLASYPLVRGGGPGGGRRTLATEIAALRGMSYRYSPILLLVLTIIDFYQPVFDAYNAQ